MYYLCTTPEHNKLRITSNKNVVIEATRAVLIGPNDPENEFTGDLSQALATMGVERRNCSLWWGTLTEYDAPFFTPEEVQALLLNELPPVFYCQSSRLGAPPKSYTQEGEKYTHDPEAAKKALIREKAQATRRKNRPLTMPQLREIHWAVTNELNELFPTFNIHGINSFGMPKAKFRELVINGVSQLRKVQGSGKALVSVRTKVKCMKSQILRDPELTKALGFRTK